MKYLSQKLSKKLHKMGAVCSSGVAHWRGITHWKTKPNIIGKWILGVVTHDLPREYWVKPQSWWKKHYYNEVTSAYDFASIMDKEALKVMFPGENRIPVPLGKYEKTWVYEEKYIEVAHQITDKYLAGGLAEVNLFLEEVL